MKMVHTRNGSNCSIQPDGCGQKRGKTKSTSGKSSSRKTFLEDSRVASHSPGSVPTNYDVNSDPELIKVNILRDEQSSSGINKNISVPVQKLVQNSQRRGVGNMPKLLAGGMNSYLHIKSFLGQEKAIELLEGWSPLSFKDKKEGPVASTSSKPAPEMSKDKPKGPQKKQKGPKDHQGKGQGKANWNRTYPQGYRIPKLQPSAVESIFNMSTPLV
ncbi:hypothetical protein O181_042604 [Austropuccinia psidii MF-1]|uniref:Uncharacterized protein n=1 Tax=Austropuccinia psidii MF-1 TaxID=1389203 RepID=A0A9Q3DGQ8_9BASI|nr:hypothetical protein [Austropuccinia psidii MF-1]